MAFLLEEEQLYIYEDSETGKRYLFDGKALVEYPGQGGNQQDEFNPYDIEFDEPDESEDGEGSSNDSDDSSGSSSSGSSDNSDNDQSSEAGSNKSNGANDDTSSEKSDSTEESSEQNNPTDEDASDESNDAESSGDSSNSDNSSGDEDSQEGSDGGGSTSPGDDSQEGSGNDGGDADSGDSGQSKSSNEDTGEEASNGGEADSGADVDVNDIDWDDIDWDELKEIVEDVFEQLEDLPPEVKKKFFDELEKHLNEVDKDVLEQEQKEREAQIEKELSEYNPEDDESEARLKEIADDLDSEAKITDLLDETDRKVQMDRSARRAAKRKAEKEANKYNASSTIGEFTIDVNKLIKSQVKKITKSSWGKMNKKTEGTGIMKPGKLKKKNPEIPVLAVYFDQSGSWGWNDIEVGKKAIEPLNYYVKKKQLIIEVYYFANHIHDNPQGARNEGGTAAGAELLEHVRKLKPDNVCVMTDSDFDWYDEMKSAPATSVPGGVFLLFRNGAVSKELVKKLRGRKITKIYAV